MQSTLFNALCENAKAQAANFPFCTIEPNVGIVAVPDSRLDLLWCAGLLCPVHASVHACVHVYLNAWMALASATLISPRACVFCTLVGCSKISGSEKTVPTSVEFVVRRSRVGVGVEHCKGRQRHQDQTVFGRGPWLIG